MTKTTSHLLVLCALGLAGALPALACGGGQKPADAPPAQSADTSSLDGTQASSTSASSAAPAASSSTAADDQSTGPLAQILTTDTGQIAKVYDAANAGTPATMKPNGAAGADPLAAGIRDAGKKLVAGMQADGPLATGTLKEKQTLQTDITLSPGKCYSIVGFSKKVKDLDLYLLLPPGILSGQDLSDDNKPIIGGPPQPMCPTSTTAVSYKLAIVADSGGGDVAVQLFSKGK
jgi:hypothetical protein